jgi:hypothetical protein
MPASAPKFDDYRDADAAVLAYFGGPTENPPTVNTVGAFTARDLNVVTDRTADILVKFNVTQCPLTSAGPQCTTAVVDPCAGLGGDADADGVCNGGPTPDNCPTVQNGPAQVAVANVGNQTDTDLDLVGNGCDNCRTIANPKVADNFFATGSNNYATTTGQQRDDDHDGFGNKCDADFTATGGLVAGPDLTEFRAASNKARTVDTCGTTPLNQPCARYDLNESGGLIDGNDLTVFRALSNKAKGPTCPTCPLPCVAGSTGSCVFVF